MRALVQRVTSACGLASTATNVVAVSLPLRQQAGRSSSVGSDSTDDEPKAPRTSPARVWRMRILEDETVRVADVSARRSSSSVSSLSWRDTRKGRRRRWSAAAPRAVAEPLVDAFAALRCVQPGADRTRPAASANTWRSALVNDAVPVTRFMPHSSDQRSTAVSIGHCPPGGPEICSLSRDAE